MRNFLMINKSFRSLVLQMENWIQMILQQVTAIHLLQNNIGRQSKFRVMKLSMISISFLFFSISETISIKKYLIFSIFWKEKIVFRKKSDILIVFFWGFKSFWIVWDKLWKNYVGVFICVCEPILTFLKSNCIDFKNRKAILFELDRNRVYQFTSATIVEDVFCNWQKSAN